ncbi:MAG: YxeA family protein [Kurthia sp.]|nr:YxeA family protein [Candidatus Kurthia equi]
MKKIIGIFVTVVLVLGIVGYALATVDFNRLNKESYYLQITEDGVLETTKLTSGEIMKRYNYELNAVNEEGKEKALGFSAAKNLKKSAYLKLYVKKGTTTVTSYDEVAKKDIPSNVMKKIK